MKDGTFLELAKSLKLLQIEILSRINLGHSIDLMDKNRLFLLLLFIFLDFVYLQCWGGLTRVLGMLGKYSILSHSPILICF